VVDIIFQGQGKGRGKENNKFRAPQEIPFKNLSSFHVINTAIMREQDFKITFGED